MLEGEAWTVKQVTSTGKPVPGLGVWRWGMAKDHLLGVVAISDSGRVASVRDAEDLSRVEGRELVGRIANDNVWLHATRPITGSAYPAICAPCRWSEGGCVA